MRHLLGFALLITATTASAHNTVVKRIPYEPTPRTAPPTVKPVAHPIPRVSH